MEIFTVGGQRCKLLILWSCWRNSFLAKCWNLLNVRMTFVLQVDGCPLWTRRRHLCDGLFSHEISWRKWFFVVIIIIGVWTCSWVHHYSSVTRQASPSALKMQETINRPWDRNAVWQRGGIILFTSYLYIISYSTAESSNAREAPSSVYLFYNILYTLNIPIIFISPPHKKFLKCQNKD